MTYETSSRSNVHAVSHPEPMASNEKVKRERAEQLVQTDVQSFSTICATTYKEVTTTYLFCYRFSFFGSMTAMISLDPASTATWTRRLLALILLETRRATKRALESKITQYQHQNLEPLAIGGEATTMMHVYSLRRTTSLRENSKSSTNRTQSHTLTMCLFKAVIVEPREGWSQPSSCFFIYWITRIDAQQSVSPSSKRRRQ
jgi:hypothetical protein